MDAFGGVCSAGIDDLNTRGEAGALGDTPGRAGHRTLAIVARVHRASDGLFAPPQYLRAGF